MDEFSLDSVAKSGAISRATMFDDQFAAKKAASNLLATKIAIHSVNQKSTEQFSVSTTASKNPASTVSHQIASKLSVVDHGSKSDVTPKMTAMIKFEAMVISHFVKSMLETESGEVFGEGLSGDIHKSILADMLGETIAKNGGL